MRNYKSAITTTTMLLLAFSMSASAGTPDILPNGKDIRNIKLGFYPLSLETYAPVAETDIWKHGCVFNLRSESKKILELRDLIEENVELTNLEKKDFRLRTVIHLYMNDNSQIKFLISDAQHIEPGVFGSIINDNGISKKFIRSNEKFLASIRTWANEELAPEISGSLC